MRAPATAGQRPRARQAQANFADLLFAVSMADAVAHAASRSINRVRPAMGRRRRVADGPTAVELAGETIALGIHQRLCASTVHCKISAELASGMVDRPRSCADAIRVSEPMGSVQRRVPTLWACARGRSPAGAEGRSWIGVEQSHTTALIPGNSRRSGRLDRAFTRRQHRRVGGNRARRYQHRHRRPPARKRLVEVGTIK